MTMQSGGFRAMFLLTGHLLEEGTKRVEWKGATMHYVQYCSLRDSIRYSTSAHQGRGGGMEMEMETQLQKVLTNGTKSHCTKNVVLNSANDGSLDTGTNAVQIEKRRSTWTILYSSCMTRAFHGQDTAAEPGCMVAVYFFRIMHI